MSPGAAPSRSRSIASTFEVNAFSVPDVRRGDREAAALRHPAERGVRLSRIRVDLALLDFAVGDRERETLITQPLGPKACGHTEMPDEGYLVQRVAPLPHTL